MLAAPIMIVVLCVLSVGYRYYSAFLTLAMMVCVAIILFETSRRLIRPWLSSNALPTGEAAKT